MSVGTVFSIRMILLTNLYQNIETKKGCKNIDSNFCFPIAKSTDSNFCFSQFIIIPWRVIIHRYLHFIFSNLISLVSIEVFNGTWHLFLIHVIWLELFWLLRGYEDMISKLRVCLIFIICIYSYCYIMILKHFRLLKMHVFKCKISVL